MRAFSACCIATAAVISALTTMESVQAQDVRDARVQFEVASVKPNKSSATGRSFSWQPSRLPDRIEVVRFRATNVTPQYLISLAYDLRSPEQLRGAPGWTASERFDIEGVAPSGLLWAQRLELLKALLEDRFQLAVRPETADVTVYVLVRERTDTAVPQGMRLSNGEVRGHVTHRRAT